MSWLGKTLTRKFILLLAGFLVLQALQLGIGIFGILHVGEESAAINEAGRQRMHTYHLLYLTHEALESRSWPSEGRKIVDGILADYDAESDRLEALAGKLEKYGKFREAVAVARTHWDGGMKPLLLAFDPADHQAATAIMARFEAQVPGHVRHLDEIVNLMERDAAEDARRLALFQAVLLGLTLLLGMIGFAMARYVVTLPLRRLTEGTRAIAAGAYDKRVTVTSHDEL
ncbi:MAG TPA: HAMP domain-containing protein, partial [Burkholderiales bacterium]|nr:HAMP domain-containing protein [Burkholderiales bacterium]